MPADVSYRPRPAVLVHCELDTATAARTALAADLARRTGARLIGAAAAQRPVAVAAYPRLAGGLADTAERDLFEALTLAAKEFGERTTDLPAVSWRSALEPAAGFLASEAAGADLVVVGPLRPGAGLGELSVDTAAVVMTAGRPVLLAPEGLERLDLRRVMLAWKETREARRAALDALPLMTEAEEVLIVNVAERPGDERLETVRDWLCGHAARVEIERRPAPSETVAEELLAVAESEGVGLIVAGAYSRAPLQERVFGGVTHELLRRGRAARLLSR
jgi:nucleotide-binding universal stress UspA family protein